MINMEIERTTAYFREIQILSNLTEQDFGAQQPHISVSARDLYTGVLSQAETQRLFTIADKKRWDNEGKPVSIRILISLKTLVQNDRQTALLLLPATLDGNGCLNATLSTNFPWIPATRLDAPGTIEREVMVGTLQDYWTWRNTVGRQAASEAEGWEDAVNAAHALFDSVAHCDLTTLYDDEVEIFDDRALIALNTTINANDAIVDLYTSILHGMPVSPVYKQLLSTKTRQPRASENLDLTTEELLANAVRATGSMSSSYPLTPSQRRALHGFLMDGDGSLTAVSGPPGTGKTTMLQAVVATFLVDHALAQKAAPVIVGTSTNNQAVTNIIDSFAAVSPENPGLLDGRWLPQARPEPRSSSKAQNQGDVRPPAQAYPAISSTTPFTDTALRSLAVYCPSQSKLPQALNKGYLIEDARKSRTYSAFSSTDYTTYAIPFFLETLARYCAAIDDAVPRTLDRARKYLHTLLASCEHIRVELLELRSRLDRSVEDAAGAPIHLLQKRHQELAPRVNWATERKYSWMRLAATAGSSSLDQELAIQAHRLDDEPRLASPQDYIAYYNTQLVHWTTELDQNARSLRAAHEAGEYTQPTFIEAARSKLKDAARIGLLSTEDCELLTNSPDVAALDRSLDTTLRYVEFWLAVHYYEAQWLLAIADEKIIPERDRWQNNQEQQETYWSQSACLTPCFVMTAFQVPKYFKLWARNDEWTHFDRGRIDLLIVDEAGQVDTSLGSALFALPKRALVVGDVQQLAPIWSIDPRSDKHLAASFDLAERWEEMRVRGLTASAPSSLMKAASTASHWCYGEHALPGLFLAEHFRCHPRIISYCNDLLYDGMLEPCRSTQGYALEGRIESPFMFHAIAGSQDQSKGHSRVNLPEARAIAQWIERNFHHFSNIYNPENDPKVQSKIVGVVTPFTAQTRVIKQEILKLLGSDLARLITVGTAHTLQGTERPVILFSAVYGDNSPKASFIDGNLELMNVAVSRAKDLFIIFASQRRWQDEGTVFSLVRQYADRSSIELASPTNTAPEEPALPGNSPRPLQTPARATESTEPALPMDDSASENRTESASPLVQPTLESVPTPAQPAGSLPSESPTITEGRDPSCSVISSLLKEWGTDSTISLQPGLTAKRMNQRLVAMGFLYRDGDGHLRPTPKGTNLGISCYSGGNGSETYINVQYSPQASAAIRKMIISGELKI